MKFNPLEGESVDDNVSIGVASAIRLPLNCRGQVRNEAPLRTGGATSFMIPTWPVRSHVMIFFTPIHQYFRLNAWEDYLQQAREAFDECVYSREVIQPVSRCIAIARCVDRRLDPYERRQIRGILVLAVPDTQIGQAVPEGGLYVHYHEHYLDGGGADERLVLYLMPPYQ